MSPIRIFIDCTVTQAGFLRTGIERVVRNIATHTESAEQAVGVYCRTVRLTPAGYILVPVDAFQKRSRLVQRTRTSANKVFARSMYNLSRTMPRPLRKYLMGNRYEPSLARLIVLLLHPFVCLNGLLLRHRANRSTDSLVTFQPGDILLLADSVWNYLPWEAVQNAKKAGAWVAAIVYDIIPLTHPQFFAPVSCEKFAQAMALLVQHADAFVSISAFTELQLRQYVRTVPRFDRVFSPAYAHFALGAELDLLESGGKTREGVREIFSNRGAVYLAVGTLEPRKNHGYLLQSFQTLWDVGVDVSLLIVGRVGWMSDALLSRIKAHALWGQRLFFLDDASDTELDYCYSHARAVVLTSLVEGFGLPLVEALHKGRPVFASDIPVFREVGGAYPAYFDVGRADALSEQIQAYEASGYYTGRQSGDFPWPSWSQSCDELLAQLLALHARR